MNDNMLDFLLKINELQKTKRYGNHIKFSESTSEHTFKLILMVDYFYKTLNLNLDYEKCICLSIYHDFGEMDLVKDIDIKENTKRDIHQYKEIYELEKIKELSDNYYKPIAIFYKEYKDKNTEEARFVNACDKLEGVIHLLATNEKIMNHELSAIYADKAVKNFPKLMPIYKQIKEMLKVCYEEWGFEWKKEYDDVFEDNNN